MENTKYYSREKVKEDIQTAIDNLQAMMDTVDLAKLNTEKSEGWTEEEIRQLKLGYLAQKNEMAVLKNRPGLPMADRYKFAIENIACQTVMLEYMDYEDPQPEETIILPVKMNFNGREIEWDKPYITYEEIEKLMDMPEKNDIILSVTYFKGPKENPEGSIHRSQSAKTKVCEGMIITAGVTNNA